MQRSNALARSNTNYTGYLTATTAIVKVIPIQIYILHILYIPGQSILRRLSGIAPVGDNLCVSGKRKKTELHKIKAKKKVKKKIKRKKRKYNKKI